MGNVRSRATHGAPLHKKFAWGARADSMRDRDVYHAQDDIYLFVDVRVMHMHVTTDPKPDRAASGARASRRAMSLGVLEAVDIGAGVGAFFGAKCFGTRNAAKTNGEHLRPIAPSLPLLMLCRIEHRCNSEQARASWYPRSRLSMSRKRRPLVGRAGRTDCSR